MVSSKALQQSNTGKDELIFLFFSEGHLHLTLAPRALAAMSTVAKPSAPAAAVTKTVWLE